MKRVCLVGYQYDDSNNGVNALTLGTLAILKHHNLSDALQVFNFAKNSIPLEIKTKEFNYSIPVLNLKLRIDKQFFDSNAFWLLFLSIIYNLFSINFIRSSIDQHEYFKQLKTTDLFISIAGGDSFSDIYGIHRYITIIIPQLIPILMGKKLIQFPQKFGPYKNPLIRLISFWVLKKSSIVYTRDKSSYNAAVSISKDNIRFSYDVAFSLTAEKPPLLECDLNDKPTGNLIGFNVSGLLYNGGYNRNNMFGLRDIYTDIVNSCIEKILDSTDFKIMLIPHVFGDKNKIENDSVACEKVFGRFVNYAKDRLIKIDGIYNALEIKHIIGLCNFFIGSRMHACIAAVSQCIPSVGIAYSDKFQGLFGSIGMEKMVVDARIKGKDEISRTIIQLIKDADTIKNQLIEIIPKIQQNVLNLTLDI